LREFEALNTPLYNEMEEIVRGKYSTLTPLIMKFMKSSSGYYSNMGSMFGMMQDKCANAYREIAPLE
jgi:hypothetical protein